MNNLQQFLSRIILRLMNFSLVNRGIIYAIDLTLCLISFAIAVYNRIYILGQGAVPDYEILGLVYTGLCAFTFAALRSHRGLNRHASFRDMWRPFMGLMLSSILLYGVLVFFEREMHGRLTFSMNVFLFNLASLLFVRFWVITIYTYAMKPLSKKTKKTLMVGTGAHSIALAQWINSNNRNNQHVIGYITRDQKLKKKRIQNLPVYVLEMETLDFFMTKHDVSVVHFPDYQSVKSEQDFIAKCREMGISVVVSPPLEGLDKNGEPQFQIKAIQFEDLLGREEIRIDLQRIANQLNNKVIMITGAAGSIGSEIVRQLGQFKPKMLILFDVAETPLHNLRLEMERTFPELSFLPVIGDVRSQERLNYVFSTHRPDAIFHAAAYKHVPLMEENPCEAVLVNVFGTMNVANMAVSYGSESFVMVSTDKAVNPTNVMGATKRAAEIYVQSLAQKCKKEGKNIRFVTTRFGNVLGSNGSVIPHFKAQIEKGGPVTVTHPDIIRYFMTIPEACRLVLEASSFGKSGEIYVFDMGEPVKIVDLARRMIELAGLVPEKDIRIEYIGLRPGEKLYEELLNDKEITLPTENEKITIAQVRLYEYNEVTTILEGIIEKALIVNIPATITGMKNLIPEFISKNSPFESLDKTS